MNNLDFTFLTEDQIFGDNQLDILKQYGTKCAITDFAILLGEYVLSDYYTSEGNSRNDRTGWWWTKTPYENDARIVYANGSRSWDDVDKRAGGARPALPYSSISRVSSNKVREQNGILEVEYGEYPQTVVLEEFAKTLESAYLKGTITKTGKSYTTDSVNVNDENKPFQARKHIEYEYNGKKYIRFVADSNCSGKVLSDGRIIKEGEVYWVEVEPIKWMMDKRANIALAKKILFSGVQFMQIEGKYKGKFNKTVIKKFMDTYFSKDIIPSKTINNQKENAENKKIDVLEIIKEINNYLDKYLGNNKEDFNKQIKELINNKINNYNSKLESIKNNNSLLTFENNDVQYHYSKLVMELKDILEKLKQYFNNYKSSYEVINIVNNLLNILNNNEYNKDDLTELDEYFITIKEVILPYIDNNEDIINKINTILNNTKKDIINNLSILEMDSLENIKINDKENKPKEELLLELRKNIHPILIELNNLVRNRDLKNEIERESYNIMNNNYSESKNKLIGRYLNLINTLAREIKNKTDNQEELLKLKEILNFDIDYRKDINQIISKLLQIINSLYGLLFNIEENQKSASIINDYKIDIDKLR